MQEKIRIIRRILVIGLISAIGIGGIVSLIGLIFGWRNDVQFSDGCCYAGAVVFLVGWLFLIPLKKKKQTDDENKVLEPEGSVKQYDENPLRDEIVSDLTKGRRLFALFGWTGAVLIVIGILIYTIIG